MEERQQNKPHHAAKSGASVSKKIQKKLRQQAEKNKGSNPKAFAISRVNRVRKRVAHALDK